jgi:hypothetical protein
MFGSENILSHALTIDADPGGTDKMYYLFKAPRDLTIKNGYATSELAMGAGTAVKARVENWGTAGTSVGGTVSSYVFGTAAPASARTPTAMTLDSTQTYIDEGEWVVLHVAEDGGGWQSGDRLHVQLDYVLGKI